VRAEGITPTAVPEEIRAALGADPTPEQWRAISAPLAPTVVVAGPARARPR
jgi:hypothetical protein